MNKNADMQDVSTLRLYVLRAAYLLILIGLGVSIWPLILNPPPQLEHFRGVVWSILTAVSLLAALGIRYPLKMLPLLFFELVWKVIWMLLIGLPIWKSHQFSAATAETWNNCLFGVVLVPLVLPWRYVWEHYVIAASDRWSGSSSMSTTAERNRTRPPAT